MKKFKSKVCFCGNTFTPTAPCNLYCSEHCKTIKAKEAEARKQDKSYARWAEKQRQLGRGHVVGVGRGGSNKRGSESPFYKNNISFFMKMGKIIKEERKCCEVCGKNLEAVNQYGWCLHHIDHDRNNNTLENFMLLCKRCHQIEHECWKAFEGATTIPEGSTLK
jgi:hypothetical protein